MDVSHERVPVSPERVPVELTGVSETLLWTLHHRAAEARREDRVLDDPLAVELVDRLDFPFRARFGQGAIGQDQGQALRALRFDLTVRDFLAAYPGGQVVALGDGLETQFWRVDDGTVRWLSVDLPAVVELRRRLLPEHPRARMFAGSALDRQWMREVDTSRPLLVTAQGLFMYLPRARVTGLLAELAESAGRLPAVEVVFDAVPHWFAALTRIGLRLPSGFRVPTMYWGLNPARFRDLTALHRNVVEVEALRLPAGRGLAYGQLYALLYRLPLIRGQRLWIVRMRFAVSADRCRACLL